MEIKIETSEIISHLENVSNTDQTPFNKEHYYIIRSFLESQGIWVCNSSTLCEKCGYPTGQEEHPAICSDCANVEDNPDNDLSTEHDSDHDKGSGFVDEESFLNEEEKKAMEDWCATHCMFCGDEGHHDSKCPHSGILTANRG